MAPRTQTARRNEQAEKAEQEAAEQAAERAEQAELAEQAEQDGQDGQADSKPKRNRNKALKPVPLDVLGIAEDVPEEEWADAPIHVPDERDAAQLVIDAEVKDAYAKWVDAGKPGEAKSPRKRRLANPEHAPAIRQMIGNAARFLGVRAILAKPFNDQHGREVIVFTVRDKVARDRSADAVATAAREWAKANNVEVNDRGRVPEDVMTAFKKQNGNLFNDKGEYVPPTDDKSDDKSDDNG